MRPLHPAPAPTPPLSLNLTMQGDNFSVLRGHKNAVLDLCWAPSGGLLFSASADGTAAVWDAESGARVRTLTRGLAAGGSRGAAGRILNSVAAVGDTQCATVGCVGA